jgi:hypothetical protein
VELPSIADSLGVLLADARRAGAIRADQQMLLEAAYVSERPTIALATVRGATVEGVYQWKRRAVSALVAFCQDGDDR